MDKYCFGIDVGGTTVKCGLFGIDGEVLEKWEVPTRTEDNGKNILPDVAASINAKIEERSMNRDEIAGVGIGVPGPVNDEGEVPVAVNLHWGYVHIVKEMEQMTGLKVKAGNDANVAALGEQWKGGGVGYHNLIMVTLGTGIGGGVIINDKILTGSHGAGGEIGHAHVEDAIKDACNCGNCGCLEQVASATGIARLAREELASCDEASVLRGREEVSARLFLTAGKRRRCAGNPCGRALWTLSWKDSGSVRVRDRSGSVCNRRRRVQSRSDPAELCRKILSEICIFRMPQCKICAGFSGK